MKAELLRLLQTNHTGKQHAATVSKLASELDYPMDVTGKPIRSAVRELIKVDGIPVGSCPKGFYIIDSEKEKEQAIANLVSRVVNISLRIAALKKCQI